MGRARGLQVAASKSSVAGATSANANTRTRAAVSEQDRFAATLGTGRGRTHATDEAQHDQWRTDLLAAPGHTIIVSEAKGSTEIRPVCASAIWMGNRHLSGNSSYIDIVQGELCLDPSGKEWVGLLRTGPFDSAIKRVVLRSHQLQRVLDSLQKAMENSIEPNAKDIEHGGKPLQCLEKGEAGAFIGLPAVEKRALFCRSLPRQS